MKSIALVNNKTRKSEAHWLDQMAKQLVFKSLSDLKHERLTIEDQGETISFGEIAGEPPLVAHIHVTSSAFYRQVLMGGSVGAGEAYINKLWTSPNLVNVIRVFAKNIQLLNQMDSKLTTFFRFTYRIAHKLRPNSLNKAKENIGAHYDLSNDFFSLFLDKTMLYSAAIFRSDQESLEQASLNKMERICQKLQLSEKDHLLEIGSGWGGMAIYAAKHYGCRVTTLTLSKEQFDYATTWIAREGLADKICVKLQDYREAQGLYDKIVSIEMIEAVGHEYYENYFNTCSKLLKDDGLLLIQAITIPDQRYSYALQNSDFIQQYIFPGGCLPSIEIISKQIKSQTDLSWVDLKDITQDYAKTLYLWRDNFTRHIEDVKSLGFSDAFIRMWDFYLCYCEGGFQERAINTYQLLFSKPLAIIKKS